ncbi:molybdate ABC transporter substrate-binding protein [Demequina rhizosphaerae]|uniref:molybdate ABC transporter substrate-binding protein n=1 Tax=Demequina rhizosphaerae TaxID=1638985 RepID=UPI0007839D09|nr:molybdate ABC transporter substrate-binding protein [Demequina rhizosphaerae]
MRSSARVVAVGVGAAAALGGCAVAAPDAGTAASAQATHVLDVYAAASLSDVMGTLAAGFEVETPGVDVRVTYGGSSDLAAQILEGAPAAVFASADEAQMAAVADEVAGEPVIFATNSLTVAVPAGNPAGVTGLESLADDAVVTVVCAPQVPCGAATATLAELQGVDIAAVSEETSVTGVLGKVAAGQADAGVVYVTEVARAAGVEAVPIDGAEAVVNRYPIAALAGAEDPALADGFVAYVAGADGQAALADAGFGAP